MPTGKLSGHRYRYRLYYLQRFPFEQPAAHFYENSYTLGLIDPRTGKVERMMCTHSPIYKQYRYIPNFKSILFDTDTENTLFYSFQIDSLIYQTDFKNNTLQSFGLAGHPMNTDYRETNTFEEATNNYKEDYKKFGSYRYLKYIPETKVCSETFTMENLLAGNPFKPIKIRPW